MGYNMARNLANYLASQTFPPMLVYNRTVSKSEKLAEEVGKGKVKIAENPAQVAQECDIILTSFASDAIVKSIYQQFVAVLKVCYSFHDGCQICVMLFVGQQARQIKDFRRH